MPNIPVEAQNSRGVCSIADVFQDAALLIDLGGRLIADTNDAADRGGGPFLLDTIRRYDESYLLALTGYGDADMIHFYDEDGVQVPPAAAARLERRQTFRCRAPFELRLPFDAGIVENELAVEGDEAPIGEQRQRIDLEKLRVVTAITRVELDQKLGHRRLVIAEVEPLEHGLGRCRLRDRLAWAEQQRAGAQRAGEA